MKLKEVKEVIQVFLGLGDELKRKVEPSRSTNLTESDVENHDERSEGQKVIQGETQPDSKEA